MVGIRAGQLKSSLGSLREGSLGRVSVGIALLQSSFRLRGTLITADEAVSVLGGELLQPVHALAVCGLVNSAPGGDLLAVGALRMMLIGEHLAAERLVLTGSTALRMMVGGELLQTGQA